MKIRGQHYHTIWINQEHKHIIHVIDQRCLPHEFRILNLNTVAGVQHAITDMAVRGAPLIGVAAAYGLYLACLESEQTSAPEQYISDAAHALKLCRPTAVNLAWAVDTIMETILPVADPAQRKNLCLQKAEQMKKEEIERSRLMGIFGCRLIETLYPKRKKKNFNILTHCNAGWLATIDWGTALAPVYAAVQKGFDVHVWVDETRPRNQGASLTAFELAEEAVPHTLIADNTGGFLMQQGQVDLVIVGTDRVSRNADVANKIGTYLKALAAHDNDIPFYVAMPSSSLDTTLENGIKEIPIETRDEAEVKFVQGLHEGTIKSVLICPSGTPALNAGFDITPARLVTGIISERGICAANEEGLSALFPEKFNGCC